MEYHSAIVVTKQSLKLYYEVLPSYFMSVLFHRLLAREQYYRCGGHLARYIWKKGACSLPDLPSVLIYTRDSLSLSKEIN